MGRTFRVSVRFLDTVFHGCRDRGEPEWPPSPLRLFQALVAGAASRWNERTRLTYAVPALEWLAKQPAPQIVAATGVPSQDKYRLYVPNNAADLVASAWHRGTVNASIADHRTEKDVRLVRLNGEAVHYLYPLAESDPGFAAHEQPLIAAARSVTHLGWGVDMVAGNAGVVSDEEVTKLDGERWERTADGSGTPLRVPRPGTLDALVDKHKAFLNRLGPDGFKPVPPLTAFDTVGYRRATDPVGRPFAAFRISAADPDDRPPAYDTARRCRDVAAWVRHATAEVCGRGGWPFEQSIAAFVHGHDPSDSTQPLSGDRADERFMYLPLPSIERRGDKGEHVGMIRRVLVAAPPGSREQVEWVRRRLTGQELTEPGGAPRGVLGDLQTSDWVLQQYVGESRGWSTVTPVILPGHDEASPAVVARRVEMAIGEEARQLVRARAEERTHELLLAAFRHAGLADELVRRAELEWRPVGFRAGVGLVRQYHLPETLRRWPAYHVRVRFPTRVRGPLVVGAGRYRGFGLFVSDPDANR